MIGTIKIIGANNQSHLDWMEKTFEKCSFLYGGSNNTHIISVPEKGEITIDIYKAWALEDRFAFEGFANIDDSLGRLAFEFQPE